MIYHKISKTKDTTNFKFLLCKSTFNHTKRLKLLHVKCHIIQAKICDKTKNLKLKVKFQNKPSKKKEQKSNKIIGRQDVAPHHQHRGHSKSLFVNPYIFSTNK